jgi:excisionase family DNA binding protein
VDAWIEPHVAAERLGVTVGALNHLVDEGQIWEYQFGSGTRFRQADVEDYIRRTNGEGEGGTGGVRVPARPKPPSPPGALSLDVPR